MGDRRDYFRSTDNAKGFEAVADFAQPAADCARTSERLEYIAAMIAGLRGMAHGVPQSSLPSILDSALTEIRLQLIRCAK